MGRGGRWATGVPAAIICLGHLLGDQLGGAVSTFLRCAELSFLMTSSTFVGMIMSFLLSAGSSGRRSAYLPGGYLPGGQFSVEALFADAYLVQ